MEIIIQSKFIKAGENINKGDIVKIKDEGKYRDGKYGPQLEFQLELPDGSVKSYTPNTQTQINLKEEFGSDSKEWIDKELKAWVYEQIKSGEVKMQLILTPVDWTEPVQSKEAKEDSPFSKEKEVEIKDIPF